MAQTQQEGCMIRFINNMTEEPESDLDMLFFQLLEYRKSLIGSSFYFIRADQPSPALCRLTYGGEGYIPQKLSIISNMEFLMMISRKQLDMNVNQ